MGTRASSLGCSVRSSGIVPRNRPRNGDPQKPFSGKWDTLCDKVGGKCPQDQASRSQAGTYGFAWRPPQGRTTVATGSPLDTSRFPQTIDPAGVDQEVKRGFACRPSPKSTTTLSSPPKTDNRCSLKVVVTASSIEHLGNCETPKVSSLSNQRDRPITSIFS